MATKPFKLPNYEKIALVLQGGGALGSYQAGVVEGLLQQNIEPNWVTGISIGALNTAIIAGNPPKTRLAALKAFWEEICQPNFSPALGLFAPFAEKLTDSMRYFVNSTEAMRAIVEGQKGFFRPRFPLPIMGVSSYTPDEVSYYRTNELRDTLLKYADFDLINNGGMRVSVGAVNVRTGNLTYFDNTQTTLTPEHFMASGSLPPGFPAIKIGEDYFWDGGLVSNTPLSYIVDHLEHKDTIVFQVDLWRAQGKLPSNFLDIDERMKDIQYSSRTRMVTDVLKKRQRNRCVLKSLLDRIPPSKRDGLCPSLEKEIEHNVRINIIHLIYQDKSYEGHYKDYEFSALTMSEHWKSGISDVQKTFRHPECFVMPSKDDMFVTHDVHRIE